MSILIQDLSLRGKNPKQAFSYRDLNFLNDDSFDDRVNIDDFLAVRNGIRNIIETRQGSLILDPEFGSNLQQFLFEPLNEDTANEIAVHLEDVLQQESRIAVRDILIEIDEDINSFDIAVIFTIPSLSEDQISMSLELSGNSGIHINSFSLYGKQQYDRANDIRKY